MMRINLTADHELVKAAKEMGINLSEMFRKALSDKLKSKETVDIDDIIRDVIGWMAELDQGRQKLEARKQEIINDKEREKKEIINKFKDIPEAQNLTLEQFYDTALLSKLVDLIRDKYGRRIGIVDIKRYYEIRGGSFED